MPTHDGGIQLVACRDEEAAAGIVDIADAAHDGVAASWTTCPAVADI